MATVGGWTVSDAISGRVVSGLTYVGPSRSAVSIGKLVTTPAASSRVSGVRRDASESLVNVLKFPRRVYCDSRLSTADGETFA